MRKPVKKKTAAKPSKKTSKKTSKDPIESAIDDFVATLVKSGAAKMLSKEESAAFFANNEFHGCIAVPKGSSNPV
jgi:hypothetical protein